MPSKSSRPPAVAPPPAPRRRTQAERTQQTQMKLIKGTIALLKQKRYAGFRIAEAAKVAGVSRGAQTHHFPVKDALVLQALEVVYVDTHRRALERIAQARQAPDTLMDALIADSEDFFLGDDFYMALDLMMVGGDEPLGIEVKRLTQQYRVSVEGAWLEAFVEAGYSPRQAEDVIYLTFAVTRGLSIRKLVSGGGTHFPRLLGLWQELAEGILHRPSKRNATARAARPGG